MISVRLASGVRPSTGPWETLFANLDPSTQIKLKKLIRNWTENQQVTFLISSHDLAHTTEVSNRIVLLDKGELVKDIITTPETLQELEDFFATSVESEITV